MSIHRIVMTQTIPSIGQTYQNVVFMANDDGALTPLQIATEIATYFMVRIQNFQSNFLGWQYLHIYDAGNDSVPTYIHPLLNSPGTRQHWISVPNTLLQAIGYRDPWRSSWSRPLLRGRWSERLGHSGRHHSIGRNEWRNSLAGTNRQVRFVGQWSIAMGTPFAERGRQSDQHDNGGNSSTLSRNAEAPKLRCGNLVRP